MLKHASVFVLCIAAVAVLSAPARSKQSTGRLMTQLAVPRSAGMQAKAITFDGKEALAGWAITGEVTIDAAKGRDGGNNSLKIGPGGKALLKLRERDESGKVEVWIYDDGTVPEDVKAGRTGPRWGLVQNDGKVFAVGILYAGYLGGDEGYTATACDGRQWFDKLSWLGVNRAPAGWHKWTFDFDPEVGLQVFHRDPILQKDGKMGARNDRQVNAVDSRKTGLKGFSAFAVWGDQDKGRNQTIWMADMAVTLGGPVNVPPIIEADPYEEEA